ncbi:MAG TPA: 2-phospho-L-lactate guanylyltransferase [Gaiellaceae bacterium]|jgi:2-phospho-L-lactate guanylyltransferase
MTLVVVPFRQGKSRLGSAPDDRKRLSLAMLGDVLTACIAFGEALVVTADEEGARLARGLGAATAVDPGGGQGSAVAAALASLPVEPVLVVNSDVPCVVPRDLRTLDEVASMAALALVEAADGTTNALGLPGPDEFAPLYGPGSARRFLEHGRARGLDAVSVALPNLSDDVDTPSDLERVGLRAGPRTQAALAHLGRRAVA